MEADDAALRAYYERGMERERLSDGRGALEFTRTTEIVLRRLPAAPAVVADISAEGRDGTRCGWPRSGTRSSTGTWCRCTSGSSRRTRPGYRRFTRRSATRRTSTCPMPRWTEGPAFILGDLDARMADPVDRSVALEVSRAIERVPELAGFGPHLVVTGIRL